MQKSICRKINLEYETNSFTLYKTKVRRTEKEQIRKEKKQKDLKKKHFYEGAELRNTNNY